jgi:hypothetical protein
VEAGDLNVFFLFQILADAMGLGKTVMTISLILANPGRGGMDLPKVAIPSQEDPNSLSGLQLCLQEESVFSQPIRSRIQKGQEAVHNMEVAHSLFVLRPYLASGR